MGYRSDVKFVLTSDTKKELLKAKELLVSKIKQNYIDKGEPYDEWFVKVGFHKIEQINDVYTLKFEFNDIKWYSSYPEINAFSWWLNELADHIEEMDSNNLGYHFVRIGESLDDAEERMEGNPYTYIQIFRGIDFE